MKQAVESHQGKTGSIARSDHANTVLITVEDFARMACLSRRQIDRLRRRRPPGFPREYELSSGGSKHRRCPRFRIDDVERWLDSRALW